MDVGHGIDYLLNNFVWMGWNVALALVPYLLGTRLFRSRVKLSLWWIVGFSVFMLFLPNTAYIITDVVHFRKPMRLYDDWFILAFAAIQFIGLELTGYFLFVESYRRFERFGVKKFKWSRGVMRTAVFTIVSTGVFFGRFLRLNSWDFIITPAAVLATIPSLFKLSTLFFIGIFTMLLLFIYSIHDWFFVQE